MQNLGEFMQKCKIMIIKSNKFLSLKEYTWEKSQNEWKTEKKSKKVYFYNYFLLKIYSKIVSCKQNYQTITYLTKKNLFNKFLN